MIQIVWEFIVREAAIGRFLRAYGGCTLEDVQYQLYVRQKVQRSLEVAAAGRTQSHAQVKKRLSKWLAR